MRDIKYVATGAFALVILTSPFAFADLPSLSIKDISPAGATVLARDLVTFTAVSSGFTGTLYVLTDSFSGAASTSVSGNNLSGVGKFSWTPTVSDVGTHVISITLSDNIGNSASTTQTITVLPPPSAAIGSFSPGVAVMPGTKLTFTATSSGFTNPKYSIGDTFSGTSITAVNLDTSGNFSWTPDIDQYGDHSITVYATDSLGHGASASKVIRVGAGPSISAQSFPSSTSTPPGQNISFLLSASGYSPTAFSLLDKFSGATTSTLSNQNLSSSGAFSWTPQTADIGTHEITITGSVGVYGESASTKVTVTVPDPSAAAAATVSTTTAGSSLSELLAAVAQLQSQLAAASAPAAPTPAPATPESSSGFTFDTRLYPGLVSDDVKQLQVTLSKEGFLSATPNGRYGPQTTAAVKKFQAARGIAQLGIVGPATRAALNALLSGSQEAAPAPAQAESGYVFKNFLKRGNKGTEVEKLQKHLSALGFFSVEPTGYFGSATEEAVRKFQSANGISAVGYVGPATREALNK